MSIKFSKVYLLLFVVLIFVFLATLIVYIHSLYTGLESNYSIQTIIVSGVLAFATLFLVIITGDYAKSTKEMLDEQIKLNEIVATEKRLEKVYSPIEEAVTKFDLEADNLMDLMVGDQLSENIRSIFEKMTQSLLEVKKNYGHLIDPDIIQSHSELWKIYLAYGYNTLSQAEIGTLRDLINDFHGHIGVKISEYKGRLEELQGIK